MKTRLYKLSMQRQMVVTNTFYFMLCESFLLSTVISFIYKDNRWFDEGMSVYFLYGKYLKKSSFIPSPH